MSTLSDNFGLIVRAFFTLAGVIYMIFSMSAFHTYSTNKIVLRKTLKYLVDYNDSMKNTAVSSLNKCKVLPCDVNSQFLNNNV